MLGKGALVCLLMNVGWVGWIGLMRSRRVSEGGRRRRRGGGGREGIVWRGL